MNLTRLLFFFTSFCATVMVVQAVVWKEVLKQPQDWFGTLEARQIAERVLEHQAPEGGWPKNRDMTKSPAESLPPGGPDQDDNRLPTIDNDATVWELQFLARVYALQPESRWQNAIERGLDYLFAAQYANGGWPQFYPHKKDYSRHITYNDEAMMNVMQLLREIARQEPLFAWVDGKRRKAATRAVELGLACILATQIKTEGSLSVWCAQHDEHTFAPAKARSYEHPSLSGQESVAIVKFLMTEKQPSPPMIVAVHAACRWFAEVAIKGYRLERFPLPENSKSFDAHLVPDPGAPLLWARFYELGTNRPLFSGRDGIIRYRLEEIERERRGGYAWYTEAPRKLIEKDYPKWAKRYPMPLAEAK